MSAGPRSLDAVQRWFQAVITHPEGVEGGVESEEAQEIIRLNRGELEAVITRSRNLTAAERMGVYANAYYARLLECLGECFPVLRQALSEDVFTGFAFEYLQRYPSRSYTLDKLGENFPRFLEETRPGPEDGGAEPGEIGWPDFLVDLAILEWTLAKVFDGPGTEGQATLTHEALQAFPAERFAEARLVTVPCLRLLESRFPVNAYFTAVRQAEEGEEVPLPDPAPEHTAITRRNYVVRRYTLTPPQHALLTALQGGGTVAEALAAAAAVTDLDDDALAGALGNWFRVFTAEGFFAAIE
ncbi:MAG TPA: DNA-binding domain-containing protein [Thermoanaerobaculia bacterium]|nr:DNA-binding domain-containing protein [Thermoanaerobaculia bacterium]